MDLEEHGTDLWRAGDVAPSGIYLRVDDDSFRVVILEREGRLPASYDGHVAHYCRAPAVCPLNVQPKARDAASRSSLE